MRCNGNYKDQNNRVSERQNRTLQDMLVTFCTKYGNDWDLLLNAVVSCITLGDRNHYKPLHMK